MTAPLATEAAALRSFSFGGGWQSVAALVLAARGDIDFPLFLFSNVGDDSENPGTLEYVKRYAAPFAEAHGIELVELRKVMKRTGEQRTLYQDLTRPGSRSLKIPIRMPNGKPGTRLCTTDWKIKVIGDELKRRAAARPPTTRRSSASASAWTRSPAPTTGGPCPMSGSNTRCWAYGSAAPTAQESSARLAYQSRQNPHAGSVQVTAPKCGATCDGRVRNCSTGPANSKPY